MQFEHRWYQEEAVQSVFDYFAEKGGTPAPANPVVAAPTGTGKSLIIAMLVYRIFQMFPNQRVMMLTHVKELIEQNAEKILQIWPTAPLGIFSAGLNQRDTVLPIIYGGVQSVVNRVEEFGFRDLLLVDEAHLLSQKSESSYQKVIAYLLKQNPYLRVIGFTATPFRLKQGKITDDGIFTDICYDLTTFDSFNRLIAEGYLSPPVPKMTDAFIDTSGVSLIGGEFSGAQLEAVSDLDEITQAACRETVELGYNRRSWMMFAAGVNHAEHIAECLRSYGIVAAAVHSKLSPKENDARIKAHKRGEIRALVNMGKLTTGYDHAPIDLIGMLRATNSPGLWVQMLGRGTRPSPATQKQNCLVLDFARNTPRLGPINDPVMPRKPGKGGGGDAPVRICEYCGCYNHASARVCMNCGAEFNFAPKIFRNAGSDQLLRDDTPVVNFFDVSRVIYNRHEKDYGDMIKISYFCGYQKFDEYVNFEAKSHFARKKARDWWRRCSPYEPPETNGQALDLISTLRAPIRIKVWTNKQYPEVLSHEY